MTASINQLHSKARRAIASGEDRLRHAAEYLAGANKLGATQRQSARAIGKSPAWVNALLKWKRSGYKTRRPFPRASRPVPRRVQPPEQRTELQTAKANAERAKAEFQKARAEVTARMFGPQTKQIPDRARRELLKALHMLAADHAVERARVRLGLTWDELILPAEAQSELSEAA